MCVFVTEGNSRIALAITRSLGRRGIKVIIGEKNSKNLSSASKYCHESVIYPDPLIYPFEFQKNMEELMKTSPSRVLMTAGDVTARLIYPIRNKLEEYLNLPLPDEESFEIVTNKKTLFRLAKEIGIPVPKTQFIEDIGKLEQTASSIKYPVVIKPCYSKTFYKEKWTSCLVEYAYSKSELIRKYKSIHQAIPSPIIQECIFGTNYGINLLMNRGEVVAVFSKRSIRDKPPSGGVSEMRESVPLDRRMLSYSEQILKLLKWSGVAEVEFKIDPRDNLPKLIEINGRFWSYVQLAIDSGVDFPYLLYLLSIEEDIHPCLEYRTDLKSRWLLGDLDHLLTILLLRRRNLNLHSNYPGRLRSILQFLNFFDRRCKFEVFTPNDPKPFLQELYSYAREVGKKINYVISKGDQLKSPAR